MSKYTAEQVNERLQAMHGHALTVAERVELFDMASNYAALLRERESAKAGVTDEIFEAFDAAQTKAMGEYEMQQYHAGKESHLVNALDFATRAALEAVAPMLMADSNHCQCPACVDGIIHDADCAVHNEPAMPTGPCDCSKRASLDAAIFAGNPEPDAWISTVMCVGPDYGKEYYGKLPIQSLNPLYYKHTKLYKVPPPMLASARVPDVMQLPEVLGMHAGNIATLKQYCYAYGWNDCRHAMLAAAPKPEKE